MTIDELLKAASEEPSDIKALALVTIDKNGQCNIRVNGQVFQVAFIAKPFDLFLLNLISGNTKDFGKQWLKRPKALIY